jgi:hypothetical protein
LQQIDKLQIQVATQQQALGEMQGRLDASQKDIQVLQNPNYDNLFAYMHRQVQNLAVDVDKKLGQKADRREVETALPQRLEELYRSLLSKQQDLCLELRHCATKEELLELAGAKADTAMVRELSSALSDRVGRQEMQGSLLHNLQPLVQTLGSMDKRLQAHEIACQSALGEVAERAQALQGMQRELADSQLLPFLRQHPNALLFHLQSHEQLDSLVDAAVRERLGLRGESVQALVKEQAEASLRHVALQLESLRLEISSAYREELSADRLQLQARMEDTARLCGAVR